MGSCTVECTNQKQLVSGLFGSKCFCGNNYPPEDDLVDDKNCNYPCPYWQEEACGGISSGGFYSVFNNGVELIVPHKEAEKEESATSSSSPTDAPEPTESDNTESSRSSATSAPQESASNGEEESGGGPAIGGIIGGVVAGVAVLAIAAGVGFWLFRRRRNQDIEEEHRRNAAVSSFIAGGKPPSSSGGLSMTDSRMDPIMAHRRLSDGSIADNQDYSRKILRVTNA